MATRPILISLACASSLATAGGAAAAPCPTGFSHERDDVLHDSPRKRLTAGKVEGGRVCIGLTTPVTYKGRGGTRLTCVLGYQHERAGIFHDSPKARLLSSSNTIKWDVEIDAVSSNGERRTCIAVVEPGDYDGPWRPRDPSPSDTVVIPDAKFVTGSTSKVRPLESTPNVSNLGVCRAMCKENARCVAGSFAANRTCELFTDVDYVIDGGTHPALENINKVDPSTGHDAFVKPKKLVGKMDLSRLYAKGADKCPAPTASGRLDSVGAGELGMMLFDADAPVACLLSPRCWRQVVVNNQPRYYFDEVQPSPTAGGPCTYYRLKRRKPAAPSGGEG